MLAEEAVELIKRGIIPDEFEEQRSGWELGQHMRSFYLREECNSRGMWAIVDLTWTKKLAERLRYHLRRMKGYRSDVKALEVMAGAGWLANALSQHGIRVLATDDYSWDEERHNKMQRVYPVTQAGSISAVINFGDDNDVLICSWPYMNDVFARTCAAWGTEKLIVYIGEGQGGCTADDTFFKGFDEIETIAIPQWDGMHDYCHIGRWTKGKYLTNQGGV